MAQQNLDFNIVAHTQGMEAIAALINRVGALEAETNKLRTANAALASSTDAVVKNGVRYNNAMDAQSRALRNARQGTQQFGMQINDLATSISTGASPIQAFNQQLGQIGYSLSMMGGRLGAVGNFLAGPWGAAITMGTMVLAPMIEQLFKTSDALNQVREDAKSAISSLRGLASTSVTEKIGMAQGEMTRLVEEQQRLQKLIREGGKYSFGRGQWQKELFAVNQQILSVQDAINQGNKSLDEQARRAASVDAAMKRSTGGRAVGAVGAMTDKTPAWLKPQIDEIAKLNQQLDVGVISWSEYSRALLKISDANLKADNPFKVMAMDVAAIAVPLSNLQQVLDQIGKSGMDSIRGYTDEMKKSFDAVGMSVNDAFKGMLTAGMSWKDAMRGVIQSVINELWRLFVVQQIVGLVSNTIGGAFGGGETSKAISNLAGRAIGGSVDSNTPYVVGERGPELFVPRGNGTIIPNKNMGGGSTSTINVSVDARGASDPAAVRAQVQQGILEAAPAIVAAAEKRTIDSLRRPRLGGAMQ